MLSVRQSLGGIGNLMFLKAYVLGKAYTREVPDIYVQDYRLWLDYQHHIKAFFGQGVGQPLDKVAIHIRRGDYLKAKQFHTQLWDTDYYWKAIQEAPKGKYLVFCMDRQSPEQDEKDRDWCRKNLPPLLGIYKEDWELAPIHEDEVEDLNLMAQCRWLIGANSSFAFWAAFLGEHDRVIFPEETAWFVDKQVRTKLMPEWTQITVWKY